MKLKPTSDRVIVEPLAAKEKTDGGIIIPEAAQEIQNRGTVVAQGPGRLTEDGVRLTMPCSVGDLVYFSGYAGEPYKEDGKEYKVLRSADVIGVL